MRVLCIRHGDGPEDDRVTSWCRLNGVAADIHFHSYDLPQGAVHLARSRLFEQQAFRFGETTFAFQTIEGFRRWQKVSDSHGQPGAQTPEQQEDSMMRHDRAQADWFYGFLDRFLGHART